jgi:hypothetical protein
MDTAGSGVHFSTDLHDANHLIATALDGNDLACEVQFSDEGSDSALGGSGMRIWARLTACQACWHAACSCSWIMADAQPHNHEPVGQETVPMAKSHDLTLLDVIQAVSDVAENDQEIIATVVHLISSGQVRLCDDAIEAMRRLVAAVDAAA